VGLARVTAAGLASRLGFSLDQVEDLCLAIDEVCSGIMSREAPDEILELRFLLRPGVLTVNGEDRSPVPGPSGLSGLSEVILSALVDEHSLGNGPDGPRFRLVKKLRREISSADIPGAGAETAAGSDDAPGTNYGGRAGGRP
jgi:serine/threonine-protein kinase RsbW